MAMATNVTNNEMKEKFDELYDFMAASKKVENMKLFGHVMKKVMHHIIEAHPDIAQDYIETLCAMKWHNYLTAREADSIIHKMEPAPMWAQTEWSQAMKSAELPTSEEPYYNDYALFVTMSMITSDSANTLKNVAEITDKDKLFDVVYHLALDKLKDKDHIFDIRNYFKL